MEMNLLKHRGEEIKRLYNVMDYRDGKLLVYKGGGYSYGLYIPRDESVIYRVYNDKLRVVGHEDCKGYSMVCQFRGNIHIPSHVLKWLVYNLDKLDSLYGYPEIHHINRDRGDFRLDNLECLERNVHRVIHKANRIKSKAIYKNILKELVIIDGWFNKTEGTEDDIVHLYGLLRDILLRYKVISDKYHYYSLGELVRIWEELGGILNRGLMGSYI